MLIMKIYVLIVEYKIYVQIAKKIYVLIVEMKIYSLNVEKKIYVLIVKIRIMKYYTMNVKMKR